MCRNRSRMIWWERRVECKFLYSILTCRVKYSLLFHRFRWVACQLDALVNCLDYPGLHHALATLPEGLDQTYTRILENIPSGYKNHTERILQLLLYSARPLRIEEVVDALAVGPEDEPRFDPENRLPDPTEVTRCCSSLVTLVKEPIVSSFTVRSDVPFRITIPGYPYTLKTELHLAHASVKEYLTSIQASNKLGLRLNELIARTCIAKVCLGYLFSMIWNSSADTIIETFPLAEFCGDYWANYTDGAERGDKTLSALLLRLFDSTGRPYVNVFRWQAVCRFRRRYVDFD